MRFTLVIALLLAAPAALAWHDHPSLCPFDGVVEVTDGTPEGTFYVDLGEADAPEVSVYAETNGLWHASPQGIYRGDEVEGDLQRGGASPYIPDDPETCVDHFLVMPDVLIYL